MCVQGLGRAQLSVACFSRVMPCAELLECVSEMVILPTLGWHGVTGDVKARFNVYAVHADRSDVSVGGVQNMCIRAVGDTHAISDALDSFGSHSCTILKQVGIPDVTLMVERANAFTLWLTSLLIQRSIVAETSTEIFGSDSMQPVSTRKLSDEMHSSLVRMPWTNYFDTLFA